MSQRTEPRLSKLPFVFADIVLLALAYLIFWRSQAPMTPWEMFFCAASVGLGAVLCVAPFLLAYRAALRLTEADRLANAVLQIENIEIIGRQNLSRHCELAGRARAGEQNPWMPRARLPQASAPKRGHSASF